MASTIQIAAAKMIAQGNETIASTSEVAGKRQERLGDKRKDCYRKEEQIRDRQQAMEAELKEESDDGFFADVAEGIGDFTGMDLLFGGNDEEDLQAEIQIAEVEAQGMEAKGNLVRQDLQRLNKQVGAQVRSAQSAERQANDAVGEEAAVDAKAFSRGPAVQSVAPDSSAMESVEATSMQNASEMAQVATSIQGSNIERGEAALQDSVSLKLDAIDEQREGSFFSDVVKLGTIGLGVFSGASLGMVNSILAGGTTVSTVGAGSVAASSLGAVSMQGVAGALFQGFVTGALQGAPLAQGTGALASYVADDSAARTADAGRADLAKAGAERKASSAAEIADAADKARDESASLSDRVRAQRSRLKVTV